MSVNVEVEIFVHLTFQMLLAVTLRMVNESKFYNLIKARIP